MHPQSPRSGVPVCLIIPCGNSANSYLRPGQLAVSFLPKEHDSIIPLNVECSCRNEMTVHGRRRCDKCTSFHFLFPSFSIFPYSCFPIFFYIFLFSSAFILRHLDGVGRAAPPCPLYYAIACGQIFDGENLHSAPLNSVEKYFSDQI